MRLLNNSMYNFNTQGCSQRVLATLENRDFRQNFLDLRGLI